MKYFPPLNQDDPDAGYGNADPDKGIKGACPDARGFEGSQREIVNTILAADIEPEEKDFYQLLQAIKVLSGNLPEPLENNMLVGMTDAAGWVIKTPEEIKEILGISNEVPPSTIVAAPVSSLDGYLVCHGAAVSRETYADLFAKIGTLYGDGNGSTTFNLPDFRGRFLRGVGGGAAAIGTAQGGAAPEIAASYNVGFGWTASGSGAITTKSNGGVSASPVASATTSFDFKASRSNSIYGSATEVRPINHAIYWLIKY